jgi:predicted phage-related endonuclease
MNQSQITQTATEAEELYKIVMNLYWSYLDTLEKFIKGIPETETGILNELNKDMQDVQAALEHDISVFEQAIQSDTEDLHQLKDNLQINSIYEKLKNK